ncbi:MAG: amidohydrolase family protein [Nanoarchaeota archaeon]
MPIPKIFFDNENRDVYETIFSHVHIIDAHTHLGTDKDGHRLTKLDLTKEMDRVHVNQAVVFPLDEKKSYNFHKQNDRILQLHKDQPDRFIPFFRLNPHQQWKKEYQLRIMQGFRGIKLHPRSQRFKITSTEAMAIYGQAQDTRLPIILHTGFGVSEVSEALMQITKEFPRLKLILGHSAFVELEETAAVAKHNFNILFDTSTLTIFDLLTLLGIVGPDQIAFGSDAPYSSMDVSLQMTIDTAILNNLSPSSIKAILGGNISKWLR